MSLVSEFQTGIYELRRARCAGDFVNGNYVWPDTDCSKVSGSLQPLSPRDLQILPELDRVKQGYKLYTDSELLTSSEKGLKPADRVIINLERFVVMSSERWDGTDLPYFKSILMRENLEDEARGA